MRVTSSHFVGRVGELTECEAALADAEAGAPSVLALSGDGGVGKTRLIEAFADATVGRARFLRGECVELGEGELPYGPLVAALRELVRCEDPVLERLAAGSRAALAALLPGLGEPADGGEGESAQMRVFEAMLELLALLGEELPLVLVIEDLHWADSSTRAFATFLARNLREERVLFLFSYRAEELHRRHPLRGLISDLDRGGRTRRLVIEPWVRAELQEALADILAAPPRASLVDRLFARAEGNPLYTEELLAASLDGRGAAPQSMRDAFILRIEQLSPDARRALRVLAVAGRAEESLLAQVTGLDGEALTGALREAVSRHLIAAGADERFAFRHALLREVAYEDLLPGERSQLHMALAHGLDERCREGGKQTAQLARQIVMHARAAGESALALRAAIEASAAAALIHAHGEAADMLERALELWPLVDEPQALTGIDHVELLMHTGEHYHHAQRSRAEAMFEAALAELDERAEPARAAMLLEKLARAQWGLAKGDAALLTSRHALELLPAGRADAERASVLAWIARTSSLRGRYAEAQTAAREALALTRSSGAGAQLETQLLNTLGTALAGSGASEEGAQELRAALALSRETGDVIGEAYAYCNLADLLLNAGRTQEALDVVLEGVERVPLTLHAEHLWLAASTAEAAIARGVWQLAADKLELEERDPHGRWLINLGLRRAELALGVGELEPAERALAEIEPLVAGTLEPQFHAAFGLALAELQRRGGEHALARGAIQEALDRIELCTEDAMRITAVAAAGVLVEADIAQRALDQGAQEDLALARTWAEVHIARVRAGAAASGPVEHAWALSAEAGLARALGEDEPARWERAAVAWEQLERPYPAARMRLYEAESWAERGEREQASSALASVRASATALGSRWLVDETEGLAARARLVLPDGEQGAPAAIAERARELEDPFGLTPREFEVLRLLARGSTNREIGTQLFMAEKTASVHVSRILAKLDVRSRTQAAAIAHRAGLVS